MGIQPHLLRWRFAPALQKAFHTIGMRIQISASYAPKIRIVNFHVFRCTVARNVTGYIILYLFNPVSKIMFTSWV